MEFEKPNNARTIAYYVLVVAAFVLLGVDLAGDGPQWGNVGVFVLLAGVVFLRPGGIYGTRK